MLTLLEAQERGRWELSPRTGGVLLKSSWRMRQGSVYYIASIRERLHACRGLFLPSLAVTRSQMNSLISSMEGTWRFKCETLPLMIESYLGQESTFQASVNSCKENSSPETVMLTCVVGRYGAWSRDFSSRVCTQIHTIIKMHM